MKKFVLFLVAVLSSSVAEAKLSSNKIEKERDNIQAILDVCKFDRSTLDELKAKTIGSEVASGVATLASAGGALESGLAIAQTKKEGGNDLAQLRTKRVLSTAASGVATGANAVTFTLSATSMKKLGEFIDASEKCNDALKKIQIAD